MTRLAVALLSYALLVAPFAAEGQSPRLWRIGWLDIASPGSIEFTAFRNQLAELGYVEGQSITIDPRWAEGKFERLSDFAAELVGHRVDVIVTRGTTAARAAKDATSAIPVVAVHGGDHVALGLVASLARPGGNITGLTLLVPDLSAKRLELLKDAILNLDRVAVLYNPANPFARTSLRVTESAAQTLGIRLRVIEARGGEQLAGAFGAMVGDHVSAVVILPDATFYDQRERIVELVARHRLPAIYEGKEFAESGGLMSYGASIPAVFRRAAVYVDKILKGAKPADLPVEQPTKFELVINLKTAKALGLTIPQSVLLRADEVIE